jgi:hypothetical protein
VVNKPIFKGWMQNDPWGIHFDVELTPGDVKQIACLIGQANTVEGFARTWATAASRSTIASGNTSGSLSWLGD